MRLFVAVPLPPAALEEAGGLLRSLRGHEWPVRWVRDEGLHITLKFFGEVTSDRLEPIQELLQFATAGMAPIQLALSGGGAFPSSERPRVLRLEVTAAGDLELLQDRLERGAEQIGFAPEGRPFRPHITLGRIREGHRLPAGAMQEVEELPAGSPFLADQVILFESQQTSAGPSYTVRLAQRLAASS
ncbi:MAG TPA: RNA 2',3'-cyclic phosphodiesterase [Gemmatimonadales bacterium]|jgi:2'-5' RNA ligase|nr:RNA 2',3'-cyclic phosphodiesterase [Gemmatimonadales bacterium]